MGEICRLCCSTKFVNNNIFDEANALYLKMSLYLPIKVFKDDRLPQKICDRCSCKVNDFYQFCSETLEVQSRLRALLLPNEPITNNSIDLTVVKDCTSPEPAKSMLCNKSTQTVITSDLPDNIQVKQEPYVNSLYTVKEEDEDSFGYNEMDSNMERSSDSEDMSLITLKRNKENDSLLKETVNGDSISGLGMKQTENDLNKWQMLMNSLPEGTELQMVDSKDLTVGLDAVKVEIDHSVQKEDVFHCCICFLKCYGKTQMVQHYRLHASDTSTDEPPAAPPPPDKEPLRCIRCRQVVCVEEWGRHWARHWLRDRRPYRCALCEKAFRDTQQIFKHGLTHNFAAGAEREELDKRFVCDLCPEAFVYMKYLMSHRTRAHPEAAGRALALRCRVCARTFSHLNSLRRHFRSHSGERNFLCNVCGKALSSQEHLKFHIRIHTGYKPNVCKTCGKGFVKKCNLVLHERIHSGEKPHVCSHCGKAFSQRSTLVIHERYHSGARPYVCGLCGRGFVAKGLLSMHLKTTCI